MPNNPPRPAVAQTIYAAPLGRICGLAFVLFRNFAAVVPGQGAVDEGRVAVEQSRDRLVFLNQKRRQPHRLFEHRLRAVASS